ncbi:MAG: DUF805 domain-containing protein [Hydrogenovibrio sp.]|nr:DUF805 domain-containing protein [Hydrogenovibrio sp.]
MGFQESIASGMSKYINFSGRARRSEFWWFYLFTILVTWGAGLVFSFVFAKLPAVGNFLIDLVSLFMLFPWLAMAARRLHDIGKSGWWLLLLLTGIGLILLIYWWTRDTQSEVNKYGEIPKGKLAAALI